MPNLINTVAINGSNLNTFTDVLQYQSALQAVTAATGGQTYSVDFRDHKFPIVSDNTLPTVVAEGANKPAVDAGVQVASLDVEMYAKFRQISRQMELTQDPTNLATSIVSSAAPLFPVAFDARKLNAIAVGANNNADVEYDAADPVASISAWLAAYDATTYAADGVILTRAGARKLRYAVDTQGRLQVQDGMAGATGLPTFVTGATPTQIGVATLLGIVGPFGAGYIGNALGVTTERLPQATIAGAGPEQNVVNYRIEAAMGYANGIDYDGTGRGFTLLIDAV